MENTEIEKEILAEKKSISHLRIFLLAFFAAVICSFGLFYYTTNKHADRQLVDATVFDARLQNLDNSISSHEKRIEKLEETLQAQQTSPTASATGIADIEKRITALEKQGQPVKPTAAAENSEEISQAITLLSAFYRLSSNITSGKPFIAELASFQEKFGTDNDKSWNDLLSTLSPYADSGIPTSAHLRDTFNDTVDNLNRNETAPVNVGFWQKFIFNISHMITIRKIDKSQKGSAVDLIIGRAEDHMDNDEIEAAVSEIKSLPDNTRSNFSAWLEDAQIAMIAPSIVDQLEEKVMKKAFSAPPKKEQ